MSKKIKGKCSGCETHVYINCFSLFCTKCEREIEAWLKKRKEEKAK